MRADVPLVLRRVNLEKRLRSESVRRELRDKLTAACPIRRARFPGRWWKGFSRSFRGYVYSHCTGSGNSDRVTPQNAEISAKPLTAHGFYDNFIR